MIKIIDYGVGNIQAFMTLYKRMGYQVERANSVSGLRGATRLILPGVGHFDHAMQRLNESGMRPLLDQLVLEDNIPVMGICVGMQILANSSEEGEFPGLGWIPGRVKSFSINGKADKLPLPHMGWNELKPNRDSKLFSQGFSTTPSLYFLHSFYFDADDKSNVAATAHYGIDFDAVVSRGDIHGVQCHPEKSHQWGAQLLKNFADL